MSLARHNFLKTLHGFMTVDEYAPVGIREVQKLASWASRYSAICRTLKPFTADLFAAVSGYTNSSTKKVLSLAAQRAIRLWRAALVSLELNKEAFSRPITSLGHRAAEFQIEYDASLTGLGMVISDLRGELPVVMKAVKITLPFDLEDDPGYQNTVEFMAVVVGLGCLAVLGISNAGIHIIGDNVSSLSWCVSQRFLVGRSRGTAMSYMAIGTICDLQVVSGDHVKGEVNITCDGLSREKSPVECGFLPHQILSIDEHKALIDLVEACNPLIDVVSNEGFERQWGMAAAIATQLLVSD